MREIPISKFKATCLATLAEVRRTRVPVRVTRFGKPVADIMPPKETPKKPLLGCARGEMEILGDIVGPLGAFDSLDLRRRR
jgi:antitoxin (DNA-binding transcriptional repressor) of toxin-antitoxin stability system